MAKEPKRRNRRSAWRYNQISWANISHREILAMYEMGYGTISISAKLSLDCYGINWLLKSKGYAHPRVEDLQKLLKNSFVAKAAAQAHAEDMRLLAIYESGLSINQIAMQEGVSKQRVHARLKRVGYSPRHANAPMIHTF